MNQLLKIIKALPAILSRIAHVIEHIFCDEVPSISHDEDEENDSDHGIIVCFDDDVVDDCDYESFDPPSGLSYDFDDEPDDLYYTSGFFDEFDYFVEEDDF